MIKPNYVAVFPAQAGNQYRYEGQSSLNEELDTRLRGYDGAEAKQAESTQ